jgi:ubiquitin C-terminal hydrolase
MNVQVCYYGMHYHAFVKQQPGGAWAVYDDSAVIPVGAWPDVRARCAAGRIQPSVLFFEAA